MARRLAEKIVSLLKKNIAANFAGNVWQALMGLAFIPLYIKLMGVESYGLVGIFATLQALFAILDLGLTHTLNREMARLTMKENEARSMHDLLRTMEIPNWAIAALIGGAVMAISPLIAFHWVHPESLSPDSIKHAIILMGLAMAFQWPLGLYVGGLMGLQRQVLLNTVNIIMFTFRGLGSVLVLWRLSSTIEAFFIWQAVSSACHTLLLAALLRRSLPKAPSRPRFRRDLLSDVWRFAAGITGISVLSTILMQSDKLILSRMLSLELFGYYTFASVVAINVYNIFGPVFSAAYPRLTNLVALQKEEAVISLYHKSAQLISVLTLSAVVVIALFSRDVIALWTQNPETAQNSYLLVSILAVGTGLNGLMHMPYGLQLAYGWTRLAFFLNLASVLVLVPMVVVLTHFYGGVGAASVWVILNTGYLLIGINLMHRRLIPSEKWRWAREDILLPLATSLAVAGTCRLLLPVPESLVGGIVYFALLSMVTLGATASFASVTRTWLLDKISAIGVFRAEKV